MMIDDDDTLKQLLRINNELNAAMQVSERKARHGDFIPLSRHYENKSAIPYVTIGSKWRVKTALLKARTKFERDHFFLGFSNFRFSRW